MKDRMMVDNFNSRENNFDLLRFIAATLVILSHSYPLSLGSNSSEIFIRITRGQETFGGLGVAIFFIISGFLITYSYERCSNLYQYFRNRILRIFPALLFVLFISALIMGPLLTSLDLWSYFKNGNTLGYLESFMLINMHYNLPGVFEHNPYPNAVNGSLWTLWYEFFFYILVAVMGQLKLLKKPVLIVIFLVTLLLSFEVSQLYAGYQYIKLFTYFSAGMLIYGFRNEIRFKPLYLLLSCVALVYLSMKGQYQIAFVFFGTYIIFYLGMGIKKLLRRFQEVGDFSYGMYIYAFPIQQIVTFFFSKHISPLYNFIFSLPLTFGISMLSWFFIEKKCMNLKLREKIIVENIK